jgi:hypothetical protein
VEAAVVAAAAHVTDAPTTSPATGEEVDDKNDTAIGIVDDDYDDDGMIVDIADTTPTPFLQWQSAAWPTSMVPPQSQAMYPADSLGQRFVGLERIGTEPVFTHLLDLEGMNKGTRGKDQKRRKPRTCARCKCNNGQQGTSCPGRTKSGEKACAYFDKDGRELNSRFQ